MPPTCQHHPQKHVLDNKVSEAMKELIRLQHNMTLKLVPPGCHHRNTAEVAICNFKAHFLNILSGAANNFPPNLWDQLLPQANITINLLRQSNATPHRASICTHEQAVGFQQNAIGPMGCNVQVHGKTNKKGYMGFPLSRWVVPGHVTQALSNAQMSRQGHAQRQI